MITSGFEILSTVDKAAFASGIPRGQAREIGRAAQWLSAHGIDGVRATLPALKNLTTHCQIPDATGEIIMADARVARCGLSVMELLFFDASVDGFELRAADSPVLMLGIAGVSAQAYGKAVGLTFSGGGVVVVQGGQLKMTGQPEFAAGDVRIFCDPVERDDPVTEAQDGPFETADGHWQEIAALASRIYVPESESSRNVGAGAGLTDND